MDKHPLASLFLPSSQRIRSTYNNQPINKNFAQLYMRREPVFVSLILGACLGGCTNDIVRQRPDSSVSDDEKAAAISADFFNLAAATLRDSGCIVGPNILSLFNGTSGLLLQAKETWKLLEVEDEEKEVRRTAGSNNTKTRTLSSSSSSSSVLKASSSALFDVSPTMLQINRVYGAFYATMPSAGPLAFEAVVRSLDHFRNRIFPSFSSLSSKPKPKDNTRASAGAGRGPWYVFFAGDNNSDAVVFQNTDYGYGDYPPAGLLCDGNPSLIRFSTNDAHDVNQSMKTMTTRRSSLLGKKTREEPDQQLADRDHLTTAAARIAASRLPLPISDVCGDADTFEDQQAYNQQTTPCCTPVNPYWSLAEEGYGHTKDTPTPKYLQRNRHMSFSSGREESNNNSNSTPRPKKTQTQHQDVSIEATLAYVILQAESFLIRRDFAGAAAFLGYGHPSTGGGLSGIVRGEAQEILFNLVKGRIVTRKVSPSNKSSSSTSGSGELLYDVITSSQSSNLFAPSFMTTSTASEKKDSHQHHDQYFHAGLTITYASSLKKLRELCALIGMMPSSSSSSFPSSPSAVHSRSSTHTTNPNDSSNNGGDDDDDNVCEQLPAMYEQALRGVMTFLTPVTPRYNGMLPTTNTTKVDIFYRYREEVAEVVDEDTNKNDEIESSSSIVIHGTGKHFDFNSSKTTKQQFGYFESSPNVDAVLFGLLEDVAALPTESQDPTADDNRSGEHITDFIMNCVLSSTCLASPLASSEEPSASSLISKATPPHTAAQTLLLPTNVPAYDDISGLTDTRLGPIGLTTNLTAYRAWVNGGVFSSLQGRWMLAASATGGTQGANALQAAYRAIFDATLQRRNGANGDAMPGQARSGVFGPKTSQLRSVVNISESVSERVHGGYNDGFAAAPAASPSPSSSFEAYPLTSAALDDFAIPGALQRGVYEYRYAADSLTIRSHMTEEMLVSAALSQNEWGGGDEAAGMAPVRWGPFKISVAPATHNVCSDDSVAIDASYTTLYLLNTVSPEVPPAASNFTQLPGESILTSVTDSSNKEVVGYTINYRALQSAVAVTLFGSNLAPDDLYYYDAGAGIEVLQNQDENSEKLRNPEDIRSGMSVNPNQTVSHLIDPCFTIQLNLVYQCQKSAMTEKLSRTSIKQQGSKKTTVHRGKNNTKSIHTLNKSIDTEGEDSCEARCTTDRGKLGRVAGFLSQVENSYNTWLFPRVVSGNNTKNITLPWGVIAGAKPVQLAKSILAQNSLCFETCQALVEGSLSPIIGERHGTDVDQLLLAERAHIQAEMVKYFVNFYMDQSNSRTPPLPSTVSSSSLMSIINSTRSDSIEHILAAHLLRTWVQVLNY